MKIKVQDETHPIIVIELVDRVPHIQFFNLDGVSAAALDHAAHTMFREHGVWRQKKVHEAREELSHITVKASELPVAEIEGIDK